jgi:hypothetical protein
VFTKKAIFKTLSQMGLLGMFDFIAVNSQMAWNMSVIVNDCEHRCFKLKNWKFHITFAE